MLCVFTKIHMCIIIVGFTTVYISVIVAGVYSIAVIIIIVTVYKKLKVLSKYAIKHVSSSGHTESSSAQLERSVAIYTISLSAIVQTNKQIYGFPKNRINN